MNQPLRVLAEVEDYDGFVEFCRVRADEFLLTRSEMDRLAGVPDGYSTKLLAKMKGFGRASLGPTLGILGAKIVIVEDPDMTAKILARRKAKKLKYDRHAICQEA